MISSRVSTSRSCPGLSKTRVPCLSFVMNPIECTEGDSATEGSDTGDSDTGNSTILALNLLSNSSGSTPFMTLWIGSKVRPGSWMFTSSTIAYLAGWLSGTSPLMLSQKLFAAARLWFPSPTRRPPRAWILSEISLIAFSSLTLYPVMCPPSSIRSKS